MIFDISMGLNGIPLCINVKYKGKSFNSIKRELHSILNGIPLIKSNESKWSMRIQLDWMESHYVSMYSQLILKGNHSIQLKRELHSILNGMPLLNSNESQWSMIFQWDWMESHYISNVYPINLERNLCKFTDILNWIPKQPPNKREIHPIQLKRELHSMSIETTVSMYIEWNPTD